MAKHIKDIFDMCKPNKKQKNTKPIIAIVFGLCIVGSIFLFRINRTDLAVYAYKSNMEITNSGVEISTGKIDSSGSIKGNLFYMYVKDANIDTIRYSCKNQLINFTDWTEKRSPHSQKKQFTIKYGKKTSDYRFLVIDWNPEKTIKKLAGNEEVTISDLNSNLKKDIIVMEISYMDKSKKTKAIYLTLQDNGKILAEVNNYVISEKDKFVLNPEKIQTSKPKNDLNNKKEVLNNSKYSKEEIKSAEKTAREYYSEFKWDKKIIKLVQIEDSNLFKGLVPKEYKTYKIISFKVYDNTMITGDPYRKIILAKDKEQWKIVNEGY